MENKTHYRKVFKSDHLGVADLEEYLEEGKDLIFTIKHVKQEFEAVVAGRKGNFNIAYFEEKIKPLVLNSTNSKIVKSFNNNSPFVEDWSNTEVELYIDSSVKMKGEVVGGVRIRNFQPKNNSNSKLIELTELFELKKESLTTKVFKSMEDTINNKVEKYYNRAINHLKSL